MSEPRRRLVVFVHGFGSSARCCEPLLALMRADLSLTAGYEFATFEYRTRWVELNAFNRIPRLAELARQLEAWLALRTDGYAEIQLVAHSFGGLVVQKYLVDVLQEERGYQLDQLRQVILIATPNLGSGFGGTIRRRWSRVVENPQERTLRLLDPEIADLRREIQSRVLMTDCRDKTRCAVPVQCFWALWDRVVPEASARGIFPSALPLEGNHFDVITPKGRDDHNYLALTDAIRRPGGHPRVFEIEQFEFRIAPRPASASTEYDAPDHGKTRRVRCESVGAVRQAVTFAPKNRCDSLFDLRYGTQQHGFLTATVSHDNEARPEDLREFENQGTLFVFKFRPKLLGRAATLPGDRYVLDATVYKGFDPGNRNIHLHLLKDGNRRYRRFECTLDLSAYLAAGHPLTTPPTLCFDPRDGGHSDLCAKRPVLTPHPPVRQADGSWTWVLEYLTAGVIDLSWDVGEVAGREGECAYEHAS